MARLSLAFSQQPLSIMCCQANMEKTAILWTGKKHCIGVLSRCRRTLIKVYFCILCFSFFTFVFDIFCESKQPRVIRNSVQLQSTKLNALEWWWWHYAKGHGHESQRIREERSSRTFFCAPFSEFWLHMASFCSFPVLHRAYDQGPGPSMHICSYGCMWPALHPHPIAFSLGHFAIEGRTHETSSYEYKYKCGEKIDNMPWIVLLSYKWYCFVCGQCTGRGGHFHLTLWVSWSFYLFV